MCRITWSLFLTLFSFFICSVSYAQQMYLYRMDTRPYGEIFADGFRVLGNNNNLYLYVEGETCFSGSRNAAFVSTTSSENFALEWGASMLPGTTFYVYRMIPNQNFYNAHNSLMAAYIQTDNLLYRDSAIRFSHQQEWISYGNIQTDQIVDVLELTSNGVDHPPTTVSRYSNPNYVQRNTIPNPDNFVWDYSQDEDSSSVCSSLCSVSSSSKRSIKSEVESWLYCKRGIVGVLFD